VPFATGGPTDVLARVLAPKLSASLKRNVIVDNRVGATGAIGAVFVAKAPPDGDTLLLGTSSIMAASPNLTANLPYDPVNDFVPLSLVATIENVLVIHPSVPAKNVRELIAYAKANPGKLTYASSGVGSTYHLGAASFLKADLVKWAKVVKDAGIKPECSSSVPLLITGHGHLGIHRSRSLGRVAGRRSSRAIRRHDQARRSRTHHRAGAFHGAVRHHARSAAQGTAGIERSSQLLFLIECGRPLPRDHLSRHCRARAIHCAHQDGDKGLPGFPALRWCPRLGRAASDSCAWQRG
jgi:hypothetical protein